MRRIPTLCLLLALCLAAALPAAGLQTRLFIFQHDCGHGAFLSSRAASNVIGGLIGVLTLMPYGYWRRTHAIHHGAAGDLDLHLREKQLLLQFDDLFLVGFPVDLGEDLLLLLLENGRVELFP